MKFYFLLLGSLFCITYLQAQQTNISDYVIFGGRNAPNQTTPSAPGYAVQLGSSSNIQGGNIGSYNLVKSTGNLIINGNIYSGGTIQLANSNVVTGNMAAGLTPAGVSGTIVLIGSSATIGSSAVPGKGNIDANGNVIVGGGNVYGKVTVPAPQGTYSYSGPVPAGGVVYGTPTLPTLPQMPAIKTFTILPSPLPSAITNSTTVLPIGSTPTSGLYGNVTLGGNKTLTFKGTGVYVFNSIKNTGTTNNFVFDFNGNTTGTIKVQVYGDVDVNKIKASIINGNASAASRIYFEIHGSGASSGGIAFKIANGSSSQASKWIGSVWAPFAAINIGSGTGSSNITGALWSGTQVNIQSGVNIDFAPFIFCEPLIANAGSDQTKCQTLSAFPTSFTVVGSASNETDPLWSVLSSTGTANATISTPGSLSSAIAVSGAGTVTLRLTATSNATPSCGNATDDLVLTVNPLPAAPVVTSPVIYCLNAMAGELTATGTNLLWYTASTGGTGTTTAPTPLTAAAGNTSYWVSQTNANGCESPRAEIVVTVNPLPAVPGVTTPVIYCLNALPSELTATGTSLLWYTTSTGGTGSTTAPIPSTAAAGNTSYWVSQTNANGCESPRAEIVVTVNPLPAIPGVTTPVIYCLNALPSELIATGTSLLWYTTSTGGTGSATAPTPSTAAAGNSSYWVTQTSAEGCEGPRAEIVVTVNPLPNADAGIDQPLDFSTANILTGTSTTPGVSYSWMATNGGIITSATNSAAITVSSAGTYTLTVTASSGCYSSDEVIVTSKLNSIIGSELQKIYDSYDPNNPNPPSPFFGIRDGYVKIDVIVLAGFRQDVYNLLIQTAPINYGLIDTVPNGLSELTITGYYPILNLPKLNALGAIINYVRPYYGAFNNVGLVNSAGDTTMRSNLVRSGYKIDGEGVKIGVISDSYNTITSATTATLPYVPVPGGTQTFTTNTAAQDITNGDLPGTGNPVGYTQSVTVLQDFPITRTDEGRAMLQIIHDVAPGAKLYFRTGFFTAGDFAKGIKELKDSACTIIVDDVTYITEPFLKDGIVAKTVNEVKDQGVSYFSAAGNFGSKSYEKEFTPVDATSIGFAGKKAHNFGGGDVFQKVRLAPGNYTFVFQWVDDIYSLSETGGTKHDMDIYLTKNTDGTGLIGFNRDNFNGDPIELIPVTIPGSGTDSTDYNVLIINNNIASNPSRIKFIVFRGGIRFMEFNEGNSTIVGQANAAGAIAVGAARYDKAPPLINPALIESFSSIGGTYVNGSPRQKPDLVAPDGVNTSVKLGQDYPNSSLDGYSNFFGTSAAAPHAAAVAALIMEGKKKFLGQLTTTPDEIRSLLQTTAVDMETPGFDLISGYGFIDADAAMRTFAAPTPVQIELVVPTTVIPGEEQFELTITGENFSTNSVIYIGGVPVATIFENANTVKAIINPFEGNPEIKVYTPSKSGTNGTDGGYSNTLYFFDADIVISAVSIVKKYGQELPSLDTVITINGVLLQDTTLTLADIGLSGMTLTTAATTTSNVGTYVITPSRTFDHNNPEDLAFLIKYNYQFNNGTVTINKMPLRVTPENKTITYGQHLGDVTFNYEFDPSNVPNPVAFKNEIKAYHDAFLPDNALAVVKDFKKPQAGGYVLSNADLTNMNMIASFKAVRNSRKFKLQDGILVPPTDPASFNVQYLVDIASESIFKYKTDPSRAVFYPVYPSVNSKALLGANALTSNTGQVEVNGSLIQMVNGSLVQMVNTATGPMVPIVNGSLIQIVNGTLVQLVNGVYEPVVNGSLIQMVNGTLVQLVNGVYEPLANGSLVQLVNGSLVQMVNGSLVQMVNGSLVQLVNGVYEPVANGSLVQLVNGTLVQLVNGVHVPVANGTLVQLVNGSLVQMVNGSLVQMVNGIFEPVPNSAGIVLPIINGSLVQLVNGSLVQLVNGTYQPIPNGSLVQLVNGSLVQMVNGSLVQLVNGSLVQLVNGSLVQLVNGSLVQLVNSNTIGAGTSNNNTAVIIDEADVDPSNNNWIGPMFGINMITGLEAGQQSLVPGVLVNSNFDITYGLGTVTINPATITVTANNVQRPYGETNPELTVTYSGFAAGEDLQTSGITGTPELSTAAIPTSPEGTYPISVSNGTLNSVNYIFNFTNGVLTITNNPCLLTHSTFKNFGSTANPGTATSLWMSLTTKVSGQLNSHGDYLEFKAGTITFQYVVSNPIISNLAIPDGRIVADNSVSTPITSYDANSNTWITKVPVGFSSTSDIFITGAIINSSNGFKKQNGNTGSVLKGIFYSTKPFNDQWAYAIAAYQPQFTYAQIDNPGEVVSVNGTYRAGAPTTQVQYLVNGASGGGGNNYTGSSSAFNNFTACEAVISFSRSANLIVVDNTIESFPERTETKMLSTEKEVRVIPNPATDFITVSFVPDRTGSSKIVIYAIDGRKVLESDYGIAKADVLQQKRLDISKLIKGIYFVQVWTADKVTTKKIIIAR